MKRFLNFLYSDYVVIIFLVIFAEKSVTLSISAMLKVPDGTFSWKWFKSLAQRSDLNLVGSTWPPK